MAIIKKSELKKMDLQTLRFRLDELKKELHSEQGKIFAGGKIQSPGKVREIKKTIARILTLISQNSRKNVEGEK